MKHFAGSAFWKCYRELPTHLQNLADKNFALLKTDATHRSLHFKKVGQYWSVRVGRTYRALALPVDEGLLWF